MGNDGPSRRSPERTVREVDTDEEFKKFRFKCDNKKMDKKMERTVVKTEFEYVEVDDKEGIKNEPKYCLEVINKVVTTQKWMVKLSKDLFCSQLSSCFSFVTC